VSAYLWCDRFSRMLALSVAIAIVSSFAGILLSYHAGLASGAAIVLSLGAVFLFSALFSPHYGVARRLMQIVRPHGRVRHSLE
jgi:zinc/manganese transport system permease protein